MEHQYQPQQGQQQQGDTSMFWLFVKVVFAIFFVLMIMKYLYDKRLGETETGYGEEKPKSKKDEKPKS